LSVREALLSWRISNAATTNESYGNDDTNESYGNDDTNDENERLKNKKREN
jgi:hypothetical protein